MCEYATKPGVRTKSLHWPWVCFYVTDEGANKRLTIWLVALTILRHRQHTLVRVGINKVTVVISPVPTNNIDCVPARLFSYNAYNKKCLHPCHLTEIWLGIVISIVILQ